MQDRLLTEPTEQLPHTPRAIEAILFDFHQIYEKSILEYALEYLENGDEQLNSNISLRAQFLAPTLADVKELKKLIHELEHKEEYERVRLTTRECVLLGSAYEYGLCVSKDNKIALKYYLAGSTLVNTQVSEVISNRDRGHSLANACSLYDLSIREELNEAFRLAEQAAALESHLGYAHLGNIYQHLGDIEEACEQLLKAPKTFFAHGILGFLYKHKNNENMAKYHWEQAVSLGCPNSFQELARYYESEPAKQALINYEYSIHLANYTDPSAKKEVAAAKTAFNKVAKGHPGLIEEKLDITPWQRISPLLKKEQANMLLNIKSIRLARYYIELIKVLPAADITELVILHICLPDYLQQAKASVKWDSHLRFWQQNPDSSQAQIKSFSCRPRRNSDPSSANQKTLIELEQSVQPLKR